MRTLEQAIKERREYKLEQGRQRAIELQQRLDKEQKLKDLTKRLFEEWLSLEFDFDTSELDIHINITPQGIRAKIHFDGGYVDFRNPLEVTSNGQDRPQLEIISLNRADVWHSVRGGNFVDYVNFLDAIIYAKYGNSDPADLF